MIADFIGQGVFINGILTSPDSVETAIGTIHGDRAYDLPINSNVELLIRPDDVIHDSKGNLQAEVVQKAFKGAEILYTLRLSTGHEILSLFPSHHNHEIGDCVNIRLAPDHMVAFPAS